MMTHQPPTHLLQSEGALRVCVGTEEVGEPFCSRQVELACSKGSPRKLASCGGTELRQRRERTAHSCLHGPPTVNMKLADILACHCSGAWEPDCHPPVEWQLRGRIYYE